jgi:flavin-dependent dehydrogenase
MDLLVVGGGPAGLATALHAARAGLEVSVWEQRAGTIDKACGEGLMPGAVAALAELGVSPSGHDLRGIRYVAGPCRAEADFRAGPGRGVRRTALHGALREVVMAAGVRVEQRAVHHVEQDECGVVADGTRAGYLVAADGLHSPIRRALGLHRPRPAHRRHGLRRHYVLSPWSDHVEVHWARDVEAYVTPVAGNLVGVAVLTAGRGSYDDHLAAFPELQERLAGVETAGPVRGAGPLRQEATARTAGRVLLVGDAAGYVDALTGEGIALALAQAPAAVRAVISGDLASYEREWRRLTRRYRWLTHALLTATRVRPVRAAMVPAAHRLPWLFGITGGQLAPSGPGTGCAPRRGPCAGPTPWRCRNDSARSSGAGRPAAGAWSPARSPPRWTTTWGSPPASGRPVLTRTSPGTGSLPGTTACQHARQDQWVFGDRDSGAYLPKSWAFDPDRCAQAKPPTSARSPPKATLRRPSSRGHWPHRDGRRRRDRKGRRKRFRRPLLAHRGGNPATPGSCCDLPLTRLRHTGHALNRSVWRRRHPATARRCHCRRRTRGHELPSPDTASAKCAHEQITDLQEQ